MADLVRWSSLTVGEVRRGVAAVRDRLETVEVEGREGVEHLMDPGTPQRLAAARDAAEGTLLLPGFDEYLLGYADRDAVLAPEHAERIVPGRNGVFRPTVVVGGQVRCHVEAHPRPPRLPRRDRRGVVRRRPPGRRGQRGPRPRAPALTPLDAPLSSLCAP